MYLINHTSCIPKMTPGGAAEPSGRIQYHLSQARPTDLNIFGFVSKLALDVPSDVRGFCVNEGNGKESICTSLGWCSCEEQFPWEWAWKPPESFSIVFSQKSNTQDAHGDSVVACAICLVFLSTGRRSLRGENYLSLSIGYSLREAWHMSLL